MLKAMFSNGQSVVQDDLKFPECHSVYSVDFFFFLNLLAPLQHLEFPGQEFRSEPQLWPMPQLQQQWILNPLCRTKDQTCVPALQRGCWSHCTTAGTLKGLYFTLCKDTSEVDIYPLVNLLTFKMPVLEFPL